MKVSVARALALVSLTCATSAPAAFFEEPAAIAVTSADRLVRVLLEADQEAYCDQRPLVLDLMDCGRTPHTLFGPFKEEAPQGIVGEHASSSGGRATQETDISIFSIQGSGSVVADASLGTGEEARVDAIADSTIVVLFTVPQGAPYTLSGTLEASGDDPASPSPR